MWLLSTFRVVALTADEQRIAHVATLAEVPGVDRGSLVYRYRREVADDRDRSEALLRWQEESFGMTVTGNPLDLG